MTGPILQRMHADVDMKNQTISAQLTAITRLLKRMYRVQNAASIRVMTADTKDILAGRLRAITAMTSTDVDRCGLVFKTPDGRMWTVASIEIVAAADREDIVVTLGR